MPARMGRPRSVSSERRSSPRIDVPFHARVHGIDDSGKSFSTETVLDNISGDGLYLRMMPHVEKGAKLAVDIELQTAFQLVDEGAHLSIDGVVLRSEKIAGGASGVAMSFVKVRFP